jgi:hypothetical protein
MSTLIDEDLERWTARRKAGLVLENLQGKTTFAEARRHFDLQLSEIEEWIEHARAGVKRQKELTHLATKILTHPRVSQAAR